VNLDLQSERYAATGNISGTGVGRSLGTPTHDRLRLFIREVVQNSWDARADDEHPVQVKFHVRILEVKQAKKLSELFAELPGVASTRRLISQSLDRQSICVLEVEDWGTTGLGGPVRADQVSPGEEPPDFVNFFRNVGSPRDRHLGGGTYGYGKSSAFALSRPRTIVGYTRSVFGGHPVARFMAANIGEPFEYRRKKYTGRHWWGVKAADDVVDPLEAGAAHRAAESLGLNRRDAKQRGTTLVVIDPGIEERSTLQTANAIAECLGWYFWPKMLIQPHGGAAMEFEVQAEGRAVKVPHPSTFPPLGLLADAMRIAKGADATLIRCERPSKLLGRLALARRPIATRVRMDTNDEEPLAPVRCSHLALMRPAELIVRYLTGPQLPSDMVEYGGVFICDEGVESAFADAEPPAHDDWVAENLEGAARTYVRVALRRLHASLEVYANPLPGVGKGASQQSLAVLGDALGGILTAPSSRIGGSDTRVARPRNKPPTSQSVTIGEPEPFRFAVVRKTPCALFRIQIAGKGGRPVKLRAKPYVVLEGGAAEEAAGHESPKVVAWLSGDGDLISSNAQMTARVTGDMATIVAVSLPGDCAVGLDVVVDEPGS
jgi:hypothetical protein